MEDAFHERAADRRREMIAHVARSKEEAEAFERTWADLIANKEAADRPQDRLDVAYLRESENR
jgi:hypothetical protein